jgi:hypothetical protein
MPRFSGSARAERPHYARTVARSVMRGATFPYPSASYTGGLLTTPKHGSTGLALVTCSQLVALMGGRIEVESEEENGSPFTVDLRCLLATAQPVMPARSDVTPVLSAGADGTQRRGVFSLGSAATLA